ncbi:unnamed protein product [Dimorphilus gyrociliatus]|uniref:Uncharacterized protein n=1 Tax=Dimorphilus gyrociliatus TaxID=2664684 RepID=A0A7I8VKF6_9ANNE|nr:unnamed protein product [Dimorphilus gyrociliatus]
MLGIKLTFLLFQYIYSSGMNEHNFKIKKNYFCIFRKHFKSKKIIQGCYEHSEKYLRDICINRLYSSVTTYDRITEELSEKLNPYKKDKRQFLVKRCPESKDSKASRTMCCVNPNPIANFRKNDAGCCEELEDINNNFKQYLYWGVYILSGCLSLVVVALLSMLFVEKYPLFIVSCLSARRRRQRRLDANERERNVEVDRSNDQSLPIPVIRVPMAISRPLSRADEPPSYDNSIDPSPKFTRSRSSPVSKDDSSQSV